MKNIVRVTNRRTSALREARAINKNLKSRGIMREAYVTPVSRSYVASLTRKGYAIPKKNYGIAMRDK